MLIALQFFFIAVLFDGYRTLWTKNTAPIQSKMRGIARWMALTFLTTLAMSDLLMDRVHVLRFTESMQCGSFLIITICSARIAFERDRGRGERNEILTSFKVLWVGFLCSLIATAYCQPQDTHHYSVIHFGGVFLITALSLLLKPTVMRLFKHSK